MPELPPQKLFRQIHRYGKKISFPDYVGRCNHEQKCGYNYTPKMYFDENPMAKERLSEEFVPVSKPRISLSPAPSFIEPEIMRQSLKLYHTNKLFQFLSFHFGQEATEELMLRYHVGTSKHWPGATVFWQVDISGRVRTGKVMLYNSENGRRIKEPHNYITWVHSLLKKENFNLRQCLFGEHLLSSDQQRPVALVESEKSALISSFYLPQYLWIASGGKNGAFNRDAMSVLRNRRVLLFPDLGATDYWNSKMEMIRSLGIEVYLFDFMERNATKVDSIPLCYSFQFIELPENLKSYFQRTVDKKGTVRISFASPTPKNYMYIGRNHTFVEDLSRSVVNDTINGGNLGACRAMVIETDKVDMVTTVLLMRVRSVISETKHNDNQLVGEEMIFFGYKGKVDNHDFISEAECQNLFLDSQPTGDIDLAAQRNIFNRRLEWINNEATLRLHTDDIATERANNLVRSFARYRTYLSEAEYQVVKPILPMDVIAAFVYTPKVSHL